MAVNRNDNKIVNVHQHCDAHVTHAKMAFTDEDKVITTFYSDTTP